MVIINNVNGSTFSLNGTRYIKNFMIIKQGSTNVAIHNAYDTKYQLLSSTHYSQISVNNQVYTNQTDLMAALAPVLFANSFIGGNVTSTSQLLNDGSDGVNPFVTTADLPSANKIVNQTGYNLSGETLTINPDWVWLIANQQYYNAAEVELTIPLAASGMTRIDLIVATSGSTFERITGVEAEDNAIAPPLPNNTIQATIIVVTDGIEPIVVEPTPTGDLYLEKADEKIAVISSTGTISNFGLKNYTNYYINETSSITNINGASFLASSISYNGKRIRFINKQSTPITFIHNGGTGTLKFDLINGLDYELKSNETISFIVKDGDKLLQLKESASTGVPNLQDVTDIGNSTTNGISANGGFATQNGLTDMELGIPYFGGSGKFSFNTSGDGVEFPSANNFSINANIEEWINLNTYDGNIGSTNSISLTPYNTYLYYSGVANIAGLSLNENGVGLQTTNALGFLRTDILSGDRTYQFPDADGTIALLSDISTGNTIPTLEQVTTAGNNVTDKYINFFSNVEYNNSGGMNHKNIYFNDSSGLHSKLISLTPNGLSYLSSQFGAVTNVGFSAASQTNNIYFPNASGTLALLSDIPSDKLISNSGVTGNYNIDYNNETWDLKLIGNTILTESNLPTVGKTKVISLYITGNFSLTYPSGWTNFITGSYSGTASINKIIVEYISSGRYNVTIIQPT